MALEYHERQYANLFYRIWYCIIMSQVTFSGIIVELIWSYNSSNFFFWLQVYSAYSLYTCLCAILHTQYEAYIPIAMIALAVSFSFVVRVLVGSVWQK